MAVTFKTIRPKGIKKEVFTKQFVEAAEMMASDVHYDFDLITARWKNPPAFDEKVKETPKAIELSVLTGDMVFKYYDQGNGGPTRIIKPVRAQALHWVDKSGEDVFRKWVHGYAGRHAVDKVEKDWLKKAPKYFEDAMGKAVLKSGHAIK